MRKQVVMTPTAEHIHDAPMESKAMVTVQEAWPVSGASLPVGEPVTLVIEDERFFGWVAAEAQAHSLVCVAIEFTRGGTRVQERIPVENIQRLRDYLHAHPELRQAQEPGACTMPSPATKR
jgi:hypothetical protein